MLGQDDHVYDNARLQQAARDHLWMHFTRHSSYDQADVPIIVRGEGAYIYDANGKRYLDGLAGLFVEPARPRPHRARRGRREAGRSELAFMPLWSYAHPNAIELAERVANYAPGDLNRVFFTTGGGEAVETAWKLAKNYFKLTGKPLQAQGDQPRDRLPRHPPGRAVDHRAAGHEGAVRAAGALDVPGAEHQLLPRARTSSDDEKTFGRWAADRDRGRDRERGPRDGRRGLPRAGAELRRLLPAAARLLRAGPRDLRRVRRAAGQRRGHLRVRPARPHVRRRALRLPARHDHLRQGHHLRLRPARRDDRHRPADGAVPARAPRRSSTATPSAATRSRPRWRWPTSTSSRRSSINEHVPDNEGGFRATLEKLKDLPIVGDVRGDGYFYGIELVKDKATKETFNDEESEKLLRGFLSKALYDAGLYCRADDRGDPVIQLAPAADLRPGALRRDRADPPRGADQGRHPALTRSTPARSRARTAGPRGLSARSRARSKVDVTTARSRGFDTPRGLRHVTTARSRRFDTSGDLPGARSTLTSAARRSPATRPRLRLPPRPPVCGSRALDARRRLRTSPPTTISTETSSITVPTTLICIGMVLRETPQTYIGNVVVLPAFRLVMMKSSNDSEKLSSAAPQDAGQDQREGHPPERLVSAWRRGPPPPVRGCR